MSLLAEGGGCLRDVAVLYLIKPASPNSQYAALRVTGYAKGRRVYALISVRDEGRYWADVVTGTLYSTLDGHGIRCGLSIDIKALQKCTREDAKKWVRGAASRAKANSVLMGV